MSEVQAGVRARISGRPAPLKTPSEGKPVFMRRIVIIILCLSFFAGYLHAQAGNASLTGFIQDPSKAFVPGVRVVAINTDTDQQFEGSTNKDGSYYISSLPVGPYRLQVEKVGFRTLLKEGLFLHTQ